MFEKEAEKYAYDFHVRQYEHGKSKSVDEVWQDGAEYGYNKANEWNTETPSDAVGNKELVLRVAKDDFDVGYYHFENKRFYTNDGREVTPLAWKVIVLPEIKESE